MKLRTLGLLAMGCVMASSAGALAIPLPDRGPAIKASPAGDLGSKLQTRHHFTAGQTLMVDARLGHAALALQGSGAASGETYLFAQISGAEDKSLSSPPVNLGIVIDRSGSMKGERIAKAMDAAVFAVERMREGDTVTVVSFDTRADVIVPPTTITADARRGIEARIRSIRLGGDTCISCGLEEAMHQIMAAPTGADRVSRMILLSDGATNSGIRDIPGLRALAGRMRDRGCPITTIGVDVDFDEKIMAAIANEANGRHYFVQSASGLPSIFSQEFDSLLASVARDGELAIQLAPGVEVVQVFDRSFRREGDRLIVPFGTFAKGQEKTVLVKLRVPVGTPGDRPVADLKLAYRDLVQRSDGSCSGALALDVRGDGTAQAELDPFVAARLERSRTSQTLTEVNRLFETGRMAEAKAQLAGRRVELQKAEAFALASKPAAPAPRSSRNLDRDFADQLGAVAQAEAFAPPPAGPGGGGGAGIAAPSQPGASPPAPAPATKGAVRANQQNASDLAF